MSEQIAEEIINGRRLKREDDISFLLTEELDKLCDGADQIRKRYKGNRVDLCAIINGRSGSCSEDCKFCAQSSHYCTDIEEYPFLSEEVILSDSEKHLKKGVHRYSIVTAGRALTGEEFDSALNAYKAMSDRGDMELCASHGLLSKDDFKRLKEAGVSRYHANIETSRRNFPNICTTHSFEDKLKVIKRARAAGLFICSGGIIGMGEGWEDRIDMAFDLSELSILSIPLNVLHPIKGTPYGELAPLKEAEILRTVAIFRYINPEADVRLAAGRDRMEGSGKRAFLSGANAAITGDMLTTSGNNIADDINMLSALGFEI